MHVPFCKFSDHSLKRLKERFDISPYVLSDLIDHKRKAFDLASNIDNSLIRAVPLPEKKTHIVVVQDENSGLIKTVWTPLIFEKVTALKFKLPNSGTFLTAKNERPLIKLKIDIDGDLRDIEIGRCPASALKGFDGDFNKLMKSDLFERWIIQCCMKNRFLRSDVRGIFIDYS